MQDLEEIISRINEIKREIQDLSDLRPGSLTKQCFTPEKASKI